MTPHDSENGNASHYPSAVDAAEERRLYEAAMAGRDEPIKPEGGPTVENGRIWKQRLIDEGEDA